MKTILPIPPVTLFRFLPVCISLCCSLCLPLIGLSQEEVYYGSLQRQELLATTPIFEVSDDFDFSDSVEQTQSVRDVIWFSIDEDTLVKSSTFTHWVRVTIEKYDESNTLIGTETNVQFTVSYDPAEGVRYNYGQLYEFAGVPRFKVTLTSKSSSFLGCFRLEGKIIIDRDYNFNCSAAPALLTKTHTELYDAATNALRAGWHTMPGAEEYDL